MKQLSAFMFVILSVMVGVFSTADMFITGEYDCQLLVMGWASFPIAIIIYLLVIISDLKNKDR